MSWPILIIISAVAFALRDIVTKKTLRLESVYEFSFGFYLLSTILVLPLLFYWDRFELGLNQQELGFMIVTGILYGFSAIYGWRVIKSMELSAAAPLLELNTPLVLFFGFLLLSELPTLMQLGGIALTLVGSYLITLEEGHHAHQPLRALFRTKRFHNIFMALGLGVVTTILERSVLMTVSPMAFFFWTRVFCAIFFFCAILLLRKQRVLRTVLTRTGWLMPIIIVLNIVAVLAYLYALGQPAALVSLASTLLKTKLLIAVILGGLIFREHNLKKKALASLLIVAGAIAIIL